MKLVTPRIAGAALAAALTLSAAGAGAVGLGFYGSVGGGVSDWDRGSFGANDDRRDTEHVGYGFIFDTAGPRDILAYRLSVGYERIRHDAIDIAPRYTMRGFVVDQDVTFAVAGAWPFRFWIGPELRLAWMRGEPDGSPSPTTDFGAIGLGPVIGLDYQINPGLALSWKFGYLVTAYGNDTRDRRSSEPEMTIGEGHAYATLAILFQTWGGYPQQQPPQQQPPQPGPWQRY